MTLLLTRLLPLLLSCAHLQRVDEEAASYLYMYNCTQLLPVALPQGVDLSQITGGRDRPLVLSPIVSVAHKQIWLDGVPKQNLEALRVEMLAQEGPTVLLAVDAAVTMGELSPLLGMLRGLGKTDWLLVARPAEGLATPEWVDPVYGPAILSEIQGSPSNKQEILYREFEPLAVRCGALKDALREGELASASLECRAVMASTQDVRTSCRDDAAQILTLYQVAYGQGQKVTHVRVKASAVGKLVPISETAIWSQALPLLAEFDGQEINPAVSALR